MASKLVLIIVIVLDVIAFGLAVAAEQRRSTVSFSPSLYLFHSLSLSFVLFTAIFVGLGFFDFWVCFVSVILFVGRFGFDEIGIVKSRMDEPRIFPFLGCSWSPNNDLLAFLLQICGISSSIRVHKLGL